MPNVYAILGDSNVRKSYTIRALTGAAMYGPLDIATTHGTMSVFVQISALQEDHQLPSAFITQITTQGYQNILVPLWISSSGTTFPSGYDYLRDFIAAGWNIQEVVVLGAISPPLPPGSPVPNSIPASTTTPSNGNASQIRGWWGWL